MLTKKILTGLIVFTFFGSLPATAKPTLNLVESFLLAADSTYQPTEDKAKINAAIDYYMSFFADDFTDFHAAYGVTISGKDTMKKNKLNKHAQMVANNWLIESVILGSTAAIAVIKENSSYYKNNKIKHFQGRTIFVLEFNEQGKIAHLRRYLD